MGAVYLAEHALIGRKAAIKLLLPHFASNADIVRRFFNEAKAASEARHPGIIEIYDFGLCEDGAAYIAMELLEGESLRQRMHTRGRLPVTEAMAITAQLAAALSAAHDKGIVHRDLKPDNIFIVPDPEIGERAKILDFGIAKLASDNTGAEKTRSGLIMGTPVYMAPEQCRGADKVDCRADYYALGCILFRMLCGRSPFVGAGYGDLLVAHIYQQPPRPSGLEPTIPRGVDDLILRLLAKDPQQRPSSYQELAAMLPGGRVVAACTTPAPGMSPVIPTPLKALDLLSTLSIAGGSIERPPARSRARAIVLCTALVVAIAGMLVLLRPSINAPQRAARLSASEDQADAAAPGPATSEPRADVAAAGLAPFSPLPAPPRITIEIDTTPPGANVLEPGGSTRLGSTPFKQELDARDGELGFVLRRAGYDDQALALPADRSAQRTVVLVPAGRARAKPRRASAARPGQKVQSQKGQRSKIDTSRIQAGKPVNPF